MDFFQSVIIFVMFAYIFLNDSLFDCSTLTDMAKIVHLLCVPTFEGERFLIRFQNVFHAMHCGKTTKYSPRFLYQY